MPGGRGERDREENGAVHGIVDVEIELTPAERAVFLLHEVFDYGYPEVADMIDKSETACRKLFSRAKRYLAENRPRFATTRPRPPARAVLRFLPPRGSSRPA